MGEVAPWHPCHRDTKTSMSVGGPSGAVTTSVGALLSWLHGGRGDGSFERRFKHIIDVPLLVLDDFGLVDLAIREQTDVYEIVCERYESRSTIITSNREVSEWFSLFGNPLLATTVIDRVIHRAIRFVIDGPSYRLTESQNINKRFSDFYNLTEGEK